MLENTGGHGIIEKCKTSRDTGRLPEGRFHLGANGVCGNPKGSEPADRYLILKAEVHNWGFVKPGSWNAATWYVFNTGFYRLESSEIWSEKENLEIMEVEGPNLDPSRFLKCSIKRGRLSAEKLSKLISAIEQEPWRDHSVICNAYDGEAWAITQFAEDGSIVRTSGDFDYIYGHRVLETIVSLLPKNNLYCSSAFVSLKRNN